jgi:hypothetical protein
MTDELTDLLQTAARTTGHGVRPDSGTLIARARRNRRRQRMAGLCAAVAMVLVGAAAIPALIDGGDGGVEVAAGEDQNDFKPGWTRLPDPPLSPRVEAVTVWTGREIVVVGGSEQSCMDVQGCAPPVTRSFKTDGAAFDMASRTWRPIAPAPIALSNQMQSTEFDGDVYVLAACLPQRCEPQEALLRYRPLDDAWDVLPPAPTALVSQRLSGPGGSLLAYGSSLDGPIWRFESATSSWIELPENPLAGRTTDAVVLGDGEDVVVFGRGAPTTSIDAFDAQNQGARLSRSSGKWTMLPPALGGSVQPRVLDGLVVQAQAIPGPGGGILDLELGTWTPLPARPAGAPDLSLTDAGGGTVGALGRTDATFSRSAGWVLDTVSRSWVEVPQLGDRQSDSSFTSFGRHLFSFGGTGRRGLLNDAWVWTPPPAEAAPMTTLAPSAPSAAVVPDPVTVPTSAPPPATTPVPGAPVFVSATADATKGQLTVRFDRPVTGDPVDKSPGSKSFSPDKTHPMNLIVYGSDKACSLPKGNGQDYVSGLGTDTVTVEASSLAAGTTYISISPGFVKNVIGGTMNESVVVQGLPPTVMFQGSSCIPVKVAGTVPATTPYTDPAGGPKLLSATASAGGGKPGVPGGAGAGRVTLTFDKLVVPGDGPNFDGSSPHLQPAAGDNYMRAMQLVVHTTDSTCSSPDGNAHEYLSGVGTTTLTVDVTSLVVGTTYISIAPGFAKGQADGKAMAWVRCLALEVTP